MFDAVAHGLLSVFTWPTLPLMMIGILIGFIIGILPGISAPTTLALMLPFTFHMEPVQAFAFLLGMLSVSIMFGDITSILFGVPGEPLAAAVVLDGHPMAKNGEAGRASPDHGDPEPVVRGRPFAQREVSFERALRREPLEPADLNGRLPLVLEHTGAGTQLLDRADPSARTAQDVLGEDRPCGVVVIASGDGLYEARNIHAGGAPYDAGRLGIRTAALEAAVRLPRRKVAEPGRVDRAGADRVDADPRALALPEDREPGQRGHEQRREVRLPDPRARRDPAIAGQPGEGERHRDEAHRRVEDAERGQVERAHGYAPTNASRSALSCCLCVSARPCGAPGRTIRC